MVKLVPVVASLLVAAAPDGGAPARSTCVPMSGQAFTFRLERVPLSVAVQVVTDVTCKSFKIAPGIESVSITATAPGGKKVSGAEMYELFVAALHAQGLEVKANAGQLEIVRKAER